MRTACLLPIIIGYETRRSLTSHAARVYRLTSGPPHAGAPRQRGAPLPPRCPTLARGFSWLAGAFPLARLQLASRCLSASAASAGVAGAFRWAGLRLAPRVPTAQRGLQLASRGAFPLARGFSGVRVPFRWRGLRLRHGVPTLSAGLRSTHAPQAALPRRCPTEARGCAQHGAHQAALHAGCPKGAGCAHTRAHQAAPTTAVPTGRGELRAQPAPPVVRIRHTAPLGRDDARHLVAGRAVPRAPIGTVASHGTRPAPAVAPHSNRTRPAPSESTFVRATPKPAPYRHRRQSRHPGSTPAWGTPQATAPAPRQRWAPYGQPTRPRQRKGTPQATHPAPRSGRHPASTTPGPRQRWAPRRALTRRASASRRAGPERARLNVEERGAEPHREPARLTSAIVQSARADLTERRG